MAGALLYGFHQLKDIVGDRVEDRLEVVNDAIADAVAEHNRQLEALLGLFVERTTDPSARFTQYASTRSQPLDQNGRALPIKPAGHYDVAWPIQASGNAWGVNHVSRELMTVQDANDITRTMLDGDIQWVWDHVLASLFANASWNFPDEQYGTLAVSVLANNDTVTYARKNGAAATDQHFLATNSAIADANNPFPTIYNEITEHPENSGDVITLVPTNLMSSIEGLADYHEAPDPNIELGVGNDRLTGSLSATVPGVVRGYVNRQWIVEVGSLVNDYTITVTTDGRRALRMREYPVASLQGFKQVGQRDDHPFYESQYARWAGFGAWNRVGAVVHRFGNSSYATPTNFASPMP